MRVAIGQSERFLYGHYGWKTLEIIVQVDNKKTNIIQLRFLKLLKWLKNPGVFRKLFFCTTKIPDQDRMINVAVLRKHPNWWCVYIYMVYILYHAIHRNKSYYHQFCWWSCFLWSNHWSWLSICDTWPVQRSGSEKSPK